MSHLLSITVFGTQELGHKNSSYFCAMARALHWCVRFLRSSYCSLKNRGQDRTKNRIPAVLYFVSRAKIISKLLFGNSLFYERQILNQTLYVCCHSDRESFVNYYRGWMCVCAICGCKRGASVGYYFVCMLKHPYFPFDEDNSSGDDGRGGSGGVNWCSRTYTENVHSKPFSSIESVYYFFYIDIKHKNEIYRMNIFT